MQLHAPPLLPPLLPPPSPAAAAINPSWQSHPRAPSTPPPQFPSIFDPFSRPSLSQIFQVPPAGSPRFQGLLNEHKVQHRAPRDLNTFSYHGPPLLFFSPLRLGCPPPRKMVDKLGQIARVVGCPVPCAPSSSRRAGFPGACRPGGRASMPTWAPGAQCTGRWRSGAASAVMA